MKTILTLAAVAVAASLVAVIPMLNSSFAAQDNPNQTANPNSLQNQAVQDNNSDNDKETDDANDQETNDDGGNDSADSIDPQFASQAKITADQARDIAISNISAQSSDVKSVSLDDENGQLVYSVDVTKAGTSFDVKVDAISGQVANVDQGTDNETENDNGADADNIEYDN